jgi:hypothetical protein
MKNPTFVSGFLFFGMIDGYAAESLTLIKLVINQLYKAIQRSLFVFAFGQQMDFRTFAGCQHHHSHDAFAVDHAVG